jgi:hypothetical protein
MVQEIIGKSGAFILDFKNIHGSGWDDDLQKIIEKYLNPIKLSKRIVEQSWDYSEKEFDLEKDNIKFILHLDDDVSPYFSLKKENITLNSKEKLREWATIVDIEIEKLKNS